MDMQNHTPSDELDRTIFEHRTSQATITVKEASGAPLADTAVTLRQKAHRFLFGCNIFKLHNLKTPDESKAYGRHFKELLNFATLPFYWGSYEPVEGKTNVKKVQKMARWCNTNGIRTKGHPLVWHEVPPKWMDERDLYETERMYFARITRELHDFEGLVDMWDVVNEAVVLPVFNRNSSRLPALCHQIGRIELLKRAFDTARAAAPKSTLVLNDFNVSPDYEEVISRCIDAGVSFDVIGIQSHMHAGYWGAEKTLDVLERFSKFGKPLHFTELTILSGELKTDADWQARRENWKSTPEGEQTQAEQAAEFYKLLFAHPAVEAITWWDFTDQGSWMGAPSGLIRDDTSPKPVYDALMQLIKKDWWTPPLKLKTDSRGRVSFRGFLGRYSIKANGTSSEFELDEAGKTSKTVKI